MSKSIMKNFRVLECDNCFDDCEPYKWEVVLKEGYVFADGRNSGCRTMKFEAVMDFLNQKTVTIEEFKKAKAPQEKTA